MAIRKTKAGTYSADLSFIKEGKRRRVQKTFKRKGDAEAWLIKQKTLRAQGINKKSTHFSWLFDHYYKIYKEPFIRPNTKSTWSLSRKAFIKYFGEDVHTGYKMLENTDLKLSVFQHFFILVSY